MTDDNLKVLFIEDSEEDVLILVNELYRGGYTPLDKRVETAEDMMRALSSQEWDIIISDWAMPEFSGPDALKLFTETKLDIPFIMVSGTIGEEVAVESLRAGAKDFVAKSNLARFLPAVNRELEEAKSRRERVEAERALEEQEKLFGTIMKTMGEGACILDLDEKIRFANNELESILQTKNGDLIGRSFFDFLDAEGRETVKEQMASRTKGVRSSYDLEIECSGGQKKQLMITANPIFDEDQVVSSTFAIIRDVTESRKAHKALEESELRLKAITDAAKDAIIMIDNRGMVSYWNPAAEDIFGYSFDEISGQNLHSLITPERFMDAHNSAFPQFVKTGQGGAIGKTLELDAIRKGGREFPVELSLSAIQINNSWHAIGILRDISERKRHESQALQTQKMESIGTLASGIAHEINTPTQFVGNNIRFLETSFNDLEDVLKACVELKDVQDNPDRLIEKVKMVEQSLEDADYKFLLEEIPLAIEQSNQGIQNITRIVSAMRSFAHPGYEDRKLTDIHKAIESTVTISRNEWKYDAELTTDFDPDLPSVPCFPNEFNQVILNLIVNAAHAIAAVSKEKSDGQLAGAGDSALQSESSRGLIHIATKKDADFVEVKISDTGCGIPDSFKDRVFDPFFTTKDVGKGTGQGLTLAYNVITEKHGGELSFESKEGSGTTFTIRLPLSPKDE